MRQLEVDADQKSAVAAAVAAAWEEGCPVAGQTPDEYEQIAEIAIRRWASLERRHSKSLSAEGRVEDLAKALAQRFDTDPEHVGPVMEDYRYLAQQVAAALGESA